MAGKFGATCSRAAASLFSPRHRRLLLPSTPTPPRFLPFSHRLLPRTLSTIAMAAPNGAAATDAVHEPPQKISKIAPLLKVKKLSDKAVLPSRGSALAAGYDLSRYALRRRPPVCPRNPRGRADLLTVCFFCVVSAAEMVVPARGKALVPTDLSIAIPEGTYARVGERPTSPVPLLSRLVSLSGCLRPAGV